MDLKVVCVLSAILVIALSTLAEGKAPPTRCQCKQLPRERRNCGYPGISAAECRKAGCCFNASVPGVPWCFAPKAKKESVRAAVPVLQGLGVCFTYLLNVNYTCWADCNSCLGEVQSNLSTCTVRKVCPNDAPIRINCGFPGITAQECERKGCCFRAYPAGVPWCFYHRVMEEAC